MKKFLITSSVLMIVVGIVMIGGGLLGIAVIYQNVIQEKIVTPDDASIPNVPVRGPFTLKAQADIIKQHTLRMTNGQVFAEMPRQVPKLDANGNPVLGNDGKPVMVANTSRDIWITATTLTTALHLGIVSYAIAGLAFILGLVSILIGTAFYALSKRQG